MISELQNLQASMGAIFGTLNTGESVPMSFGNHMKINRLIEAKSILLIVAK